MDIFIVKSTGSVEIVFENVFCCCCCFVLRDAHKVLRCQFSSVYVFGVDRITRNKQRFLSNHCVYVFMCVFVFSLLVCLLLLVFCFAIGFPQDFVMAIFYYVKQRVCFKLFGLCFHVCFCLFLFFAFCFVCLLFCLFLFYYRIPTRFMMTIFYYVCF